MEIKKYFIILIFSFLFSNLKLEYNITFYGISMANVNMNIENIIYQNTEAIKLDFITTTNNITSKIFEVDNEYYTIIDKNNFNILFFAKSTIQPRLINKIKTINQNDTILYENTNIMIPKNYFNIFSLLYYLSNTPFNNIQSTVNLEREGLTYICEISKKKENGLYEFELNFILDKNNAVAAIKNSDIFTWGVFKENASKKIIIDPSNNKIINCIFSTSLSTLKANLK